MQTDVRQVFYFNAAANALGGFVEEPFRYLSSPSSAALSSSGGSVTNASLKREAGEHDKIVTWEKAHTHVSGRHVKRNGPWLERAVSIVEGLRILGGRIEAKRLVAHVHIEHPEDGGTRRISFAGSTIEGLHVDGKPIDLAWNPLLQASRQSAVDYYNHEQTIETEHAWPTLGAAAHRQASGLLARNAPRWVHDRFGWIASGALDSNANDKGYTLCSLVDNASVSSPNQSYGHCLEIPDVGRIFLGESLIYPQAVSLTMLRAELGCAVTGQLGVASMVINGSTCPPN